MRVTTVMLRVLADAVGQYGVSVDDLVRGTGVGTESFGQTDGFVLGGEFARLVSRAVELTEDVAFGLHWAERSSFAAFDLIGHVAATAPTLGDGLEALGHLYPMLSDGNEFAMRVESQTAILEFRLAPSAPPEAHVREEFIAASLVRLLRLYAGSSGMPLSVHFTYPAPPHRLEYARFFGGRERFDQSFAGIVIDRKLLEAKRLAHDAKLERDLRVLAEARLLQATVPHGYAQRVKDCLWDQPFVGRSEMKAVAERLGISERSLRRHLASEGASFPNLRIEALSARARQFLSQPEPPIKEIASSLGFSDATAFHRAFRKWTGMTPSAFRAAHWKRRSKPCEG